MNVLRNIDKMGLSKKVGLLQKSRLFKKKVDLQNFPFQGWVTSSFCQVVSQLSLGLQLWGQDGGVAHYHHPRKVVQQPSLINCASGTADIWWGVGGQKGDKSATSAFLEGSGGGGDILEASLPGFPPDHLVLIWLPGNPVCSILQAQVPVLSYYLPATPSSAWTFHLIALRWMHECQTCSHLSCGKLYS